jgi:hypothetical protein
MKRGEWDNEPDYLEIEYKGFKGIIKRNPHTGCLLGYVDLPPNHKFHGVGYDDIAIDAHGGLTYADASEQYWRIGFDCAHCGDIMPAYDIPAIYEDALYRNIDYVRDQIKNVIHQLLMN